jgi:hypothetical protein
MPFEKFKHQLDFQEEAKNAALKRQRTLDDQRWRLEESQRKEEERQREEKIDQFRECYLSAHIEEFANDFVKIEPGMKHKFFKATTVSWGESRKKEGILGDLFGKEEIHYYGGEMFCCTQMAWIPGHEYFPGCQHYSYIDIGFLEDKTLVVDGDHYHGGLTSIPEQQWRTNPQLIEDAIVKGYLHPHQYSPPAYDGPTNGG